MQKCLIVKTLLLCGLLSWSTPGFSESKPATPARSLKPLQVGTISPLHLSDQIYLAGQPVPGDFDLIQKAGVKTVINLRPLSELTWDEGSYLKMRELDYIHIPFRAPETLTPEVFDQCRKLLNDKTKRPLVLHCASANRVGAIWLAYRVLDDGLSFDDALKEAKQVGLKTPGYIERAKAYIAAQSNSE
ncbi:MAG: protein tyrosine phosphatase family protein [Planctomycetota bacterium]|jgi:uncharacterized protein (TIGR01244 family)|uniref:protein tyrosine phosphatase family protein n=1 Tax=uncultured Gimesia sp. TaxID=1678688 RepID=UPI00260CC718|nr:protein tyrosine phosphatase family protein [uncultured Gimesia sp.]